MRDNSNVGQRVLRARESLVGTDNSLANIIGTGLPNGATCYVTDRQANYRFVEDSNLVADNEFVVEAVGGVGRWVRESGLMGFALLQGLTASGEWALVHKYQGTVVQFALDAESGRVIYTGAVSRMALVQVSHTQRAAEVRVRHGNDKRVHFGQGPLLSAIDTLDTGSFIDVSVQTLDPAVPVSLQVILL